MILTRIIKDKVLRHQLFKPLVISFTIILLFAILLSTTIKAFDSNEPRITSAKEQKLDQKVSALLGKLEAIDAAYKEPLNTRDLTLNFYSEAYLFQHTDLADKINKYCAANAVPNAIALSNCTTAAKINNPLYFVYFALSDDVARISILHLLAILLTIVISIKIYCVKYNELWLKTQNRNQSVYENLP